RRGFRFSLFILLPFVVKIDAPVMVANENGSRTSPVRAACSMTGWGSRKPVQDDAAGTAFPLARWLRGPRASLDPLAGRGSFWPTTGTRSSHEIDSHRPHDGQVGRQDDSNQLAAVRHRP